MNLFKQLSEVEEIKERTKYQSDIILDYYFTDPKKATKLLLELSEIEKDLEELEEELIKIQNEIS